MSLETKALIVILAQLMMLYYLIYLLWKEKKGHQKWCEKARKAYSDLCKAVDYLTYSTPIGSYSSAPLPLMLKENEVWSHIKSSPHFEEKGEPVGTIVSFQMLKEVTCLGYAIIVYINYRPLPTGILHTGDYMARQKEYGVAATREGMGRIFVMLDDDEGFWDEDSALSVLEGMKDAVWGPFANSVRFLKQSEVYTNNIDTDVEDVS